ncbi:Topoisomerase 1-associated factor 1 like protein [Verticillium longisporum]|uniref:Topoisomerase 1-associated factor 1 n=2 Tax=Verticillium longisporum TaxID=100787 RepID=A0A8I3AMD2_VERLO|nr:Topoisomerase 1-associated factor 1 like protein [Verticillium longisporum]
MEMPDGTTDIVHPEVRAHINSLVSALGGISADDDGRYNLGDDALEVLRDLKKWIRFYDEKTNRMDVARCIAEANLIDGDLLPILATWPENSTDNKFRSRIALACFEIMVPLTWPMERDPEQTTVNHHRHMPALQLAQVGYKRSIINFDGARILHAAARVALPAMAAPIGERTPRDQGIIKLVLFFLRNVAMIEPQPNVKYEGEESQISRSATIDAFSYQDIFMVLLTIASNMGEDFRTEDVTIMEIIYHLVKRVDVKKLFMSEQQVNKAKADELSVMMGKENAMLKAQNRKGPTRHNRFGTVIWVKRADGKMTAVSGQEALVDVASRRKKMDETKKFRPPRKARSKTDSHMKDLGELPKLDARAYSQLRSFVEEFLDAGFNPLFEHVRKSIDREASHVLSYHRRQFLYLVAWFLEAERTRKSSQRASAPKNSAEEVSSFNLVAAVLNQSTFITLNRTMTQAWEHKDWPELTASMRCLTQILLTVQEMSHSPNEDDQEIAENTLSRLFYEDAMHDLIANVVRQYKEQGFDYLDAATELTHHFLRILEAYSKQNVDMQVRSRRRTRRKKKAAKEASADGEGDEDEADDSGDDEKNAELTIKERKFDFRRFSARFTPQGVVDTFVAFTKFYKDLSDEQLKRAHRYFYRVAFKHDASVMLFRVDIVHLLHEMVKGPEPLDKASSMYKEWEELAKQILRKCFKKIDERPALLIEMLFSKISSTAHYLEYGFEKQTISTSRPRPAADLEFKYTEDREQQIAIAVGVLLDKSQSDHIAWVKTILTNAEQERRALAAAEDILPSVEATGDHDEPVDKPADSFMPYTARPDNDARQAAMFKNPHLRLLMRLAGLERLAPTLDESPDSLWVVPASATPDQLRETLDLINKAEFSPPVFEEGVLAEHQLRRKTATRKKAQYDDNNDDDDDEEEDGDVANAALFPAGGPTERKVVDGKKKKKKKRMRKRRERDPAASGSDDDDDDDDAARARARARRERERAKLEKIKSQLYVAASDDETDDERDAAFFAREEAQRTRMARAVAAGVDVSEVAVPAARKEPQSIAVGDDDDDDVLLADIHGAGTDEENEDDNGEEASASSSQEGRKRKGSGVVDADGDVEMDDEDEDDLPVPSARPRKRIKGGFVMESSDEE